MSVAASFILFIENFVYFKYDGNSTEHAAVSFILYFLKIYLLYYFNTEIFLELWTKWYRVWQPADSLILF